MCYQNNSIKQLCGHGNAGIFGKVSFRLCYQSAVIYLRQAPRSSATCGAASHGIELDCCSFLSCFHRSQNRCRTVANERAAARK
ncbi:hypothetical protein QQF64_021509 [Cirrhinus molitorella]|uniref:Uncharacterized protein n=1 Tax=Cirrhinus molitorella TaxID=172907 RepID=A0ABR3L7V3_9TELE